MGTSSGLIAVAAAVIFVVVFITVAIRGGEKLMAERSSKLQGALPAEATILSYEQKPGGRDSKGRYSSIIFQLEVSMDGRPSYRTSACWKVYQMATPNVQIGGVVAVKVDALDGQLVYPNIQSVEYDWNQAQLEGPKA